MKATNYDEVREALRQRKEFIHSSMAAGHVHRGHALNPEDTTYFIYSYGYPIAGVEPDGEVWVTEEKFSRTITTKHVNITRKELAGA